MKIRPTAVIVALAGFAFGYALTATPHLWMPYSVALVLAVAFHVQSMKIGSMLATIQIQDDLLRMAAIILKKEQEAGFVRKSEWTGPWR